MFKALGSLALCVLCIHCGTNPPLAVDAGLIDSSNPDGGSVRGPVAPAPPASPRTTRDCNGLVISGTAPTPCIRTAAPPACPAGQVRFAGEADCTNVGRACEGDWPPVPTSGAVRYVKAGGTGDGSSETQPLGRIGSALTALVSTGGTVLIAAGQYDETLDIGGNVTVRGVCARDVVIGGAGTATRSGVALIGANARIENVTISPRGGTGVFFLSLARNAAADGIIVRNATGVGLLSQGGKDFTVSNSWIDGTQMDSTGRFGVGVSFELGTVATLDRVHVSNSRSQGILTLDSTTRTTLRRVSVDGVRRNGRAARGFGVEVSDGSVLDAETLLITNAESLGVLVDSGTLTIRDLFISRVNDVDNLADSNGGGISVTDNASPARVQIDNATITDVENFAVLAAGRSTVSLTDVAIDSVARPGAAGTSSAGLFLQRGASLTVTRASIRGVADEGVSARGEGTTVTLEDLTIEPMSGNGQAIAIALGAQLTLRRGSIREPARLGIGAADPSSRLTLEDVDVSAPRIVAGAYGRGLRLNREAVANVTRARFTDCHEVAVLVSTGASLTFSDLDISNTTGSTQTGAGYGIASQAMGRISGQALRIRGARGAGIAVSQSTVELDEVEISQALRPECGDACADLMQGSGIVVLGSESSLDLEHAVVDATAAAGIQRIDPSIVRLNGVSIRNAPIGFAASAADSTRQTLTSVTFESVTRTFDYRELPIPNLGLTD